MKVMQIERQKAITGGAKSKCTKCGSTFANWFMPFHVAFCYGFMA